MAKLQGQITATTGLAYEGTWAASVSAVSDGAQSSSTDLVIATGDDNLVVGTIVEGTATAGTIRIATVTNNKTFVLDTAIDVGDGVTLTMSPPGGFITGETAGTPAATLTTAANKVNGHFYICNTIGKAELLFNKVEDKDVQAQLDKLEASKKANEAANKVIEPQKEIITFDDFTKLDIRVGTILEAEKMPKTKKLLVLKVDIGIDVRTIVSGIAESFNIPKSVIVEQFVDLCDHIFCYGLLFHFIQYSFDRNIVFLKFALENYHVYYLCQNVGKGV